MRRLHLLLASAPVLIAALVLVALDRGAPTAPAAPALEAAAPAARDGASNGSALRAVERADSLRGPGAPTDGGAGFFALPPGRAFDLAFEAAFDTRLRQAGASEETRAGFRVEGRLEVLVAAAAAGERVLRLTLVEPALDVRLGAGAPDAEQQRAAAEELTRPAWVRLAPDGATLGYRFDPAASGEARNLVRSLWSSLVPVVPDPAAPSWSVDEHDASGPCRVSYRWLEPMGPEAGRLERRKVSLAAPASAPAPAVEGRGEVELDAVLRFPRRASHAEESHLEVPEVGLSATQEASARFTLLGARRVPAHELPVFDPTAPWESASGAGELRASSVAEDSTVPGDLAHLDLEELVQRIDELMAASLHDSQELYDAQRALAELLAVDEAALEALAERLAEGTLGGEVAMVLLAAAGMAQEPGAQALLAEVLAAADRPAGQRVHAGWAMLQLDAPTPAVMQSLQQTFLSPDAPLEVQRSSMFVLGALSGKLGDAQGDEVLALLVEQEPDGGSVGELVAWLEALGNAGKPGLVAVVGPYLEHDAFQVRAAAVSALRLVLTDEATGLLAGAALGDVVPTVRARAAEHVAQRALPLVDEALVKLLRQDLAALVRQRALEGLARREVLGAAAYELLVWTSEHDVEPELRALAQQILAGA